MRQLSILFILSILSLSASAQSVHIPKSMAEDRDGTMSEAYWNIWNHDVQARIDADIDRYRKADAIVYIPDAKKGTPVKVEQLTSSFYFGSNIFNFDQLGSTEFNNNYKDVFGHLLNSATVPFYWKFFEPECGHLRFEEGDEDKEEFWNNSEKPYEHFMWRRPPTEKIIRFLKEKGLRIHGHALMYPADYVWPDWVWDVAVPDEERSAFNYVKETYSSAGSKENTA